MQRPNGVLSGKKKRLIFLMKPYLPSWRTSFQHQKAIICTFQAQEFSSELQFLISLKACLP